MRKLRARAVPPAEMWDVFPPESPPMRAALADRAADSALAILATGGLTCGPRASGVPDPGLPTTTWVTSVLKGGAVGGEEEGARAEPSGVC